MNQIDIDTIEEEALLDEVENIGGPRFRRLEERADGRDLMTWKDLLAHADEGLTADNLTAAAAYLVSERASWISFIAREDGEEDARDFAAHYMEEDR